MVSKISHNDANLIRGLNKSDCKSFQRLFQLYGSQLFSFSYKYLRSKEAAEDVVQETFMKIWDLREKISINGSFRSYLITIALNSIRRHFNKLSKENEFKDELLVSLTNDSEKYGEEDIYEELLEKLEQLICQMPAKRQEVFIKKKLEGKTAKEIAFELNISIKTVEYHISEAMKFLRSGFCEINIRNINLLLIFYRNSYTTSGVKDIPTHSF